MNKRIRQSAIALVLASAMVFGLQDITVFADNGFKSAIADLLPVQAISETEALEGDGKNQTPEGDGNTQTPEGDGNTQTPESDGNTQTPESDGNPQADEAVQAVAEQIIALPDASTLDPETTNPNELKVRVEAARAAYDALTEEQKAAFDASLLEKLTTLEGALEALQNTNVAAEGDVAQIGDHFYSTLSSAISAANSGDTIYILKDFTLDSRITYKDKEITIAAADNSTFTIEDNSRCGISISGDSNLTFKNLTFATNGQIYLYNNANLTFQNSTLNMNGEMYQFHSDGYYCIAIALENRGTSLSFNDSTVDIANYPSSGSAIRWDDSIGGEGYAVSIVNTEFTSSNCYSGFVGTCNILIDNSHVHVKHRGNGSNGSNFDVKNYSNVVFEGNGSHGISATSLNISDHSVVTSTNNKMFGIYVSNGFSVDGTSTLNVTQNSSGGDFAGLKLTSGVTDGLVEAGATINITDNYCSGLSNNGKCVFEEGVQLTITGNDNDKGSTSNGGGIYNSGASANLTLPSNTVLYNNHADTAGDDIFNNTTAIITFGKVGTDWVLDDCAHAITGWFDDSANSRWNVHTAPVHAQLYDFDNTITTVTGALALKAAHPYQYDPEAPTESGEPVEWETSKSKTATNLDTNYESKVTLSLPAAETTPVTDVVFVLDRSSSAGSARQEISDMMDNLLEITNHSDAVINIGVVNFWYKADSGIALTALTDDSIASIKAAIMENNLSGTNIEAGIDAAVAMLDASTTPDENQYMVLVTDGISHSWNGPDGSPMTTWGQGNADGTVIHGGTSPYIYFDTDKPAFDTVYNTSASDEKLSDIYDVPVFDENGNELTNADIGDKYIKVDEYAKYYSSVEKGVYQAAHAYAQAASKYKCINLYWNVSDDYPLATEFMQWTATQGKCYNITDNLSGAFDDVERDITYVVDAGSSVIDVIGEGTDNMGNNYNFDFVDIDSLTVGNETLAVHHQEGSNVYFFGDEKDGMYPFVLTYYPNGLGVSAMSTKQETVVAGELFVWEINVPITVDRPVQLTYTVKLINPQTADGTYGQYDADGSEHYEGLCTNNSAVLFPVDSNGNVGEKEVFPKPTVSYTVDNGKPVNPPADPEPTPDRPSRPNRDDDNDWEPLPNAPVKENKPAAQTPAQQETPTAQQPDKYNPETGDSSMSFAAIGLAASSLLGAVLLLKQKK